MNTILMSPYIFQRGKLEIIRCDARQGWTYPIDGSIYSIRLIYDGIDYGIKETARWLPISWSVPDGTVSIALVKSSDGVYLHDTRMLYTWCPVNPQIEITYPECVPKWKCEQPLTGYEIDGCGNRRLNSACNPCTPNWQCEPGQTGYETDGCVNRRANPACLAKGSIRFTSTPAGAEIFLDGTDHDIKTPATITDVPVGSHGYTIKLDGFKDSTGTVPVLENQMAEVSVSLIPLESCIYFVTSVQGAKIFVDDVDTGKVTPSLICGLSLGSHTYRLELSGYKTVTGSVGIGAGQGVVVVEVLTPVEKGMGAGAVLGLALLVGTIGAVVILRRRNR